jgi:hypothetical protein
MLFFNPSLDVPCFLIPQIVTVTFVADVAVIIDVATHYDFNTLVVRDTTRRDEILKT